MRASFSKSVKGFRFYQSLKSSDGRRNRSPTQREIAQQEKSDFLSSCRSRGQTAAQKIFLKQGILISSNDSDDYTNESIPNMDLIKKTRSDLFSALRVVNDGGPLTQKRREVMLEAVYELERIESETDDHQDLISKISSYLLYKKKKKLSTFYIVITSVFSLMIIVNLTRTALTTSQLIETIAAAVLFIGLESLAIISFVKNKKKEQLYRELVISSAKEIVSNLD